MEIISLTEGRYEEWDRFCLESDDAWFWHTSDWLEYILHYKPEYYPESKSFYVVNDGKIIAVCPLIMETIDGIKEFSFGDDFAPAPALSNMVSSNSRNGLLKSIFDHIDVLAEDNQVSRARLQFSVLSESSKNNSYNWFVKYGYLDTSLNTRIIDLRVGLDEIRKHFRPGHRCDIKKASKLLTIVFFGNNITEDIFDQYIFLHNLSREGHIRPKYTFNVMYKAIKDGSSFLIGAKKDDKFIGFSFFYKFKNNVYYGSSCNHPDYPKIPISHCIQDSAIEKMCESNCSFYELGRQFFPNCLYYASSDKEISISSFKRGFGGRTYPLFRGEKYYDKEFFLKIFGERIKKHAESIL